MTTKSAVTYKPLGNRIIVEPVEKEEQMSVGGIYIPDTAKEKPQEGKVIAVGPGRLSDEGKRIPMDVEAGDTVVYSKYGGDGVQGWCQGVHGPAGGRHPVQEVENQS